MILNCILRFIWLFTFVQLCYYCHGIAVRNTTVFLHKCIAIFIFIHVCINGQSRHPISLTNLIHIIKSHNVYPEPCMVIGVTQCCDVYGAAHIGA